MSKQRQTTKTGFYIIPYYKVKDDDFYSMITFPNQKVIEVKSLPHNGRDKTKPYGCINIEASNKAARILKPNAYRMYIRIILNQDGHIFALSPKAMRADLGISATGYEAAVKNLIDTGYLVQSQSGSNKFLFYELPPEKRILPSHTQFDAISVVATPTNSANVPQKQGEHPPKSVEEIVHDNTKSIDNTATISSPVSKGALSYTEKRAMIQAKVAEKAREKEARRIQGVGRGYRLEYNAAMEKAKDTDSLSYVKYGLIIQKYLEENPEPKWLATAGEKFGRWIQGWDEEKQQPIVAYTFSFIEPERMKQNIAAIPKSYYMPQKGS